MTIQLKVGQIWALSNVKDNTNTYLITKIEKGAAFAIPTVNGDELTDAFFTAVDPKTNMSFNDIEDNFRLISDVITETKPAKTAHVRNRIKLGQVWSTNNDTITYRITKISDGGFYGTVIKGRDISCCDVRYFTDGGGNNEYDYSQWKLIEEDPEEVKHKPKPVENIKPAEIKLQVGQVWKLNDMAVGCTFSITSFDSASGYWVGTRIQDGREFKDKNFFKNINGAISFEWKLIESPKPEEKPMAEPKLDSYKPASGVKIEVGHILYNGYNTYRVTKVYHDSKSAKDVCDVVNENNNVTVIGFGTIGFNGYTHKWDSNWLVKVHSEAGSDPVEKVTAPNNNFKIEVGQHWNYLNSTWRVTKIDGETVYGAFIENGNEFQFVNINPDGTVNDSEFRMNWSLVPTVKEEPKPIKKCISGTKIEIGQVWKDGWDCYKITRLGHGYGYGLLIRDGKENLAEIAVFCVNSSGNTIYDYSYRILIENTIVKTEEVKPVKTGNKGTKIEVGQLWKSKCATIAYRITRVTDKMSYGTINSLPGEVTVFSLRDGRMIYNNESFDFEMIESSITEDVKLNKVEVGQVYTLRAPKNEGFRITRIENNIAYGIPMRNGKDTSAIESPYVVGTNNQSIVDSIYINWEVVVPEKVAQPEYPDKIEVGQIFTSVLDGNDAWRITKIVGNEAYGIRAYHGKSNDEALFSVNAGISGHIASIKNSWRVTPAKEVNHVEPIKVEIKSAEQTRVKIEPGQIWKNKYSTYRITRIDGNTAYGIMIKDGQDYGGGGPFTDVDYNGFWKNSELEKNWNLVVVAGNIKSEVDKVEAVKIEPAVAKIEVGQVLISLTGNTSWRITRFDDHNGDVYAIKMSGGKDISTEVLFNNGPVNMNVLKENWNISVPELKVKKSKFEAGQIFTNRNSDPGKSVSFRITKIERNNAWGYKSIDGVEGVQEVIFSTIANSDRHFEDCKMLWDITMPNNNYKIEVGQIWFTPSRRERVTKIEGGNAYSVCVDGTGKKNGPEIVLVQVRHDGISDDDGLRKYWSLDKPAGVKVEIGQAWYYKPGDSKYIITRIEGTRCWAFKVNETRVVDFGTLNKDGTASWTVDAYDMTPAPALEDGKPIDNVKIEVGQVVFVKGSEHESYTIVGIEPSVEASASTEPGKYVNVCGPMGYQTAFGFLTPEGYPKYWNSLWQVKTLKPVGIKVEPGQIWKNKQSAVTFQIDKVVGKTVYAFYMADAKSKSFGIVNDDGMAAWDVSFWEMIPAQTKIEVGQIFTYRHSISNSWSYRITRIDGNKAYALESRDGVEKNVETIFSDTAHAPIENVKADWGITIYEPKVDIKETDQLIKDKPARIKLEVGQVWIRKDGDKDPYTITKIENGWANYSKKNVSRGNFTAVDSNGFSQTTDIESRWDVTPAPAKSTMTIHDEHKYWKLNGVQHREDGPAVEYSSGESTWYKHGKLHREGGPACEHKNGKFWYRDSKRHREDGPAEEYIDGTKRWWLDNVAYTEEEFNKKMNIADPTKSVITTDTDGNKIWKLNGKYHREDGPAIEYANGNKFWYKNGNLHREDGPAIEYSDGSKILYLNGDLYHNETDFKIALETLKKKRANANKSVAPVMTSDASGNKQWTLEGRFHRDDGAAIEYSNGDKYWYKNGKQHRDDGPAIEYSNGDKYWYKNGKRHRDDGPAIELVNGTKAWFIDNKYHRVGGPAIIRPDGSKIWYKNGNKHREDGPAEIGADGKKYWYLEDLYFTEEQFNKKIGILNGNQIGGELKTNGPIEVKVDGITVGVIAGVSAAVAAIASKPKENDVKPYDGTDKVSEVISKQLVPQTTKKEKEDVVEKRKIKIGQVYSDGHTDYKVTSIKKRAGLGLTDKNDHVARGIITEGSYKTGNESNFAWISKDGVAASLNHEVWKLKEEATPTFVEQVKGDLESAGYRVASTQFTAAIKGAILLLFKDKGFDDSKLSVVKEVLESEMGTAMVSTILGYGLTYMPSLKDDPRVAKLAGEFRISGIATVGNEVFGIGMQYVMPALTTALKALPAVEIKKAVKKPAKKRRIAVAPVVMEQEQNDTDDKRITVH